MKIQQSPQINKYENRKKDYYRYNLLYNRLASFANDTQISPGENDSMVGTSRNNKY